uniref:PABS domain-containing protein n=1 Tax=Odontella aurita TaxID=265563 RepID=A0A7S4HI37_9STRA|mmetsp:Transcript_10317/g.30427  ORF Transcript_10317/g.30427 Transcript_10317/m.30427 type:complete len:188 (+) Transcript_10317:187-750(+)
MYENRMMPLGRKSSLVFALSAIFPLLHPTSVSLALDPEPQEPHGKANVIGEYIAETGFYQSMRLTEDAPIVSTRSKYQDITVVESDYYGKILVLDGVVQLTEKDADSYNEMMAHIPMMSHNAPSRVLVIGGGDGYVLSEVSTLFGLEMISIMSGRPFLHLRHNSHPCIIPKCETTEKGFETPYGGAC